jgi:two-component system osmolarity sensor histidine kinase EnvZ
MNLWRPIKRFLPRGLFWRSLIIIVAPILLLLGILSYVFFERNLETSTRALATDVAADVAFLVALEDTTPSSCAIASCSGRARW